MTFDVPAELDGYLRVADDLVIPILDGRKTGTLRYQLERDFEPGDRIALVTESDHHFATAKVILSLSINLHNVAHMDLTGLRPHGSGYDTVDEIASVLGKHYAEPVGGFDKSTIVDLIVFVVREPRRQTVQRPVPDGVELVGGVPIFTSKGLPKLFGIDVDEPPNG